MHALHFLSHMRWPVSREEYDLDRALEPWRSITPSKSHAPLPSSKQLTFSGVGLYLGLELLNVLQLVREGRVFGTRAGGEG